MHRNPFALRCTALILGTSIAASATGLSGRVISPDSTGKPNVEVRLSGSTLSTFTSSDGTWSLNGSTGIAQNPPILRSVTPRLTLDRGRLRWSLGGHDLSGRLALESGEESRMFNSPRALAVPDTLTYSFLGNVFLRDTLSNSDRTGILRVFDTTFNPAIIYGYFTDSRDGRAYRTVAIGTKVWMSQNLNYVGNGTAVGVCYGNLANNCATYGRLYQWSEIMAGWASSQTNPSDVRGICPSGWHVPSDTEWTLLLNTAGGPTRQDGSSLMSKQGMGGKDEYGFRAMAGGFIYGSTYWSIGSFAGWWSATEHSSTAAWCHYMFRDTTDLQRVDQVKTIGYSLRCVQGDPDETVRPPTFTPGAGTYTSAQQVTLSTSTPNAAIYYTTDGSAPSSNSTRYTGSFPVGANTVVRAIATAEGLYESPVSFAAYSIDIFTPTGSMKLLPGGTFTMGSPLTDLDRNTDETQHSVTLSSFWMDSTDVTQKHYQALMGVNPSLFPECGDDCPVEQTTWFDAVLFCNARSKAAGLDTVYKYTSLSGVFGNGATDLGAISADLTKNGFRLPTEAEWEYAARGGTSSAFYWGDDKTNATVSLYAWFKNSCTSTHPVAQKPPNSFGLYDMAGNVYQWTNDWYGTYPATTVSNPSGPSSGTGRAGRGGGWRNPAVYLRSASRVQSTPSSISFDQGFRCVRASP